MDFGHLALDARGNAGNVTEFVLPGASIDDFVLGVSAVGADGQESVVSAYVSPVRRDQPVRRGGA